MRISDERFDRDRRRYELAQRMIHYKVRTATIANWTGLSKYRIRTLFRAYQRRSRSGRQRGFAPFQPTFFWRTFANELEGAAFAYIALQMNLIPDDDSEGIAAPAENLSRGERLVNAFDLYRTLVPESRLTLDYATLLVEELSRREKLTLRHCDACQGLMLVETLGTPHRRCAFCRGRRRVSAVTEKACPTIVA